MPAAGSVKNSGSEQVACFGWPSRTSTSDRDEVRSPNLVKLRNR